MRVMIDISYDGSDFEGFAKQPHKNTVLDTLEQTLSKIYKVNIKAFGTSRTDSKVNALTQYVVFDPPFEINADNIVRAINSNLDGRIYCISAKYVRANYFPRHNVKTKTYSYTITSKYNPFHRNFEYFLKNQLDIVAMKKAASYLIGTHDFSSFCAANTDVKDKVRTIYSLQVKQIENKTIITINGDGFLYNMIRIIVGTLIVIGLGHKQADIMESILKAQDRSKAFSTAPAHGLLLEEIKLRIEDE